MMFKNEFIVVGNWRAASGSAGGEGSSRISIGLKRSSRRVILAIASFWLVAGDKMDDSGGIWSALNGGKCEDESLGATHSTLKLSSQSKVEVRFQSDSTVTVLHGSFSDLPRPPHARAVLAYLGPIATSG
jgi:hypothetical protein